MLKKANKNNILFWALTLCTFAISRLINIKVIPIFTDEAIYSYWAQVALHDPQHRFISLEDGKQPLFIWLAAVAQKFIEDPLVATRMVSILSGFGSLVGVYLLSNELFNKKVAKISAVLYTVIPFTLLYNRMALFDSLLTMFGIYAIYLTVKMAKKPDLAVALLNGFAIGLAMITKSSGNFFLYLIPASIILFKIKGVGQFAKWIALSLTTAVLSILIFNSLRLSPLFYLIARKNLEFIRSTDEVIKLPFEHFFSNLNAISGWLTLYLSPPLFFLFIFSIIIGIYKKNLKVIYLTAIFSAPMIAELLFNKILYARFVLFYFPFIIITTAFGINFLLISLKLKKSIKLVGLLLILIIPIWTSLNLVTNPTKAKIPKNDADQYFNSWPAGYGISEVVSRLKEETKTQDVYVATEGTFGLLPYAINIYFYQNPKLHLYSFWPLNPDDLPKQVLDFNKSGKTYVIFNETQKQINSPYLKFLNSYQKGDGDYYLRLYEVLK